MIDYANDSELEFRLRLVGLSNVDADVSELTGAISAASRRIDDDTGRRFWLDDIATSRYYGITHPRKVVVDDIGDATGLEVAIGYSGVYSVVPSSAYRLKPENAGADSEPYWMIERVDRSQWPIGSVMRVTARFGWPATDVSEVPDPIHEACLIMSARLFRRKDSPDGYAKGLGGEGFARINRFDPDYEDLIKRYVRP